MKHEEIVEAIRNIESHPKFNTDFGICCNAGYSIFIKLFPEFFRLYPNFSGDELYPVKHPTIPDPYEAFEEEACWEGEYGEERRKFLQWLADNIQPDWYISCI